MFLTFLDLRSVAQRVLHRGHRDLDGGEFSFILSLFCRHPDFVIKDIWNVSRIYISSAPEPYQEYDCFWVERQDGSIIDLSYNKCVNSDGTPMINFIKAARQTIRPNLEEFIEQEYVEGQRCPLSGMIMERQDAVVEHYPRPLEMLVMDFVKENDIDIEGVQFNAEEVFIESEELAGFRTNYTFADEELAERFLDYHAENAEMQLIHLGVFIYQPQYWKKRFAVEAEQKRQDQPYGQAAEAQYSASA